MRLQRYALFLERQNIFYPCPLFFVSQYRLEPEVAQRVTAQVKKNNHWGTLEHLRPKEDEIKMTHSGKTHLTGMSRRQLYCLAKFSEWMILVQVQLYLPNLLND